MGYLTKLVNKKPVKEIKEDFGTSCKFRSIRSSGNNRKFRAVRFHDRIRDRSLFMAGGGTEKKRVG